MNNEENYKRVTDSVLAALAEGTVPWRKPWREGGANRNLQSGRPYRGVNTFLTEMRAMAEGFDSPFWTTYKGARKSGGHVRKGQRGTQVVLWKFLRVKDEEAPAGAEPKTFPMLRLYTVFNADQCDGLDLPAAAIEDTPVDPIAECDRIIAEMPAAPEIRHGGDSAHYIPALDEVGMPARDRFTDSAAYYAVAFHELGHATGHASRLARDGVMETHKFGSSDYGREELVAEMTASMVAQVAGIGTDTLPRSASYVDSWLKTIGEDPKAVIWAAGRAQKAADWILDNREAPADK